MKAFFDEKDSARIAATVAEVEARTTGEVVVVTTARSGEFRATRCVAALVVGLTAALVARAGWPWLGIDRVLFIELAAGLLAYLATAFPPLLRRLVGRRELERVAREGAVLAFAEYGVFDTRDRTGVLIYLSALEHRAVILGDKGIYARAGQGTFDRLVAELTESFAEHHGASGVCRVVEELGVMLARDLPPRPDDTNELPNAPIHAGPRG